MQQRSASGLPRGSQTSLRQRARSVGQRGGLAVASSAKATPAPFAHLPSTPRNGKRRRSVGHALRCGVTSLNDMLADGSKSSSTANPFEALVSDHDVDFAAMAATQKSAFEPAPKRIRDEESLSRSRGRSRSQSRRRTLLARRHAGECATCDTSISGETGESCRSKIVELRRRCDEQQHELRLRQARIVTLQQSLKQTESKVSEQSAKLRTLQVVVLPTICLFFKLYLCFRRSRTSRLQPRVPRHKRKFSNCDENSTPNVSRASSCSADLLRSKQAKMSIW
ncbi:MAG: hypothetical protein MHM6MM_002509 [Cercozoa sp. M6MM]